MPKLDLTIPVGMRLHTRCGRRKGNAIVVAVQLTHPDLLKLSSINASKKSYVVQTEFGNVMTMLESELIECYTVSGTVVDVDMQLKEQLAKLDTRMAEHLARLYSNSPQRTEDPLNVAWEDGK